MSGVLRHVYRLLGCMVPMVSMLCMIRERLMNGLRCLVLRKGHHRAVRQAHKAKQYGQNNPKVWAESPERSHGFYVELSPRRGQLTFGNPAVILTLPRGWRKSAAMTKPHQTVFFRRRAAQAPGRDRM